MKTLCTFFVLMLSLSASSAEVTLTLSQNKNTVVYTISVDNTAEMDSAKVEVGAGRMSQANADRSVTRASMMKMYIYLATLIHAIEQSSAQIDAQAAKIKSEAAAALIQADIDAAQFKAAQSLLLDSSK